MIEHARQIRCILVANKANISRCDSLCMNAPLCTGLTSNYSHVRANTSSLSSKLDLFQKLVEVSELACKWCTGVVEWCARKPRSHAPPTLSCAHAIRSRFRSSLHKHSDPFGHLVTQLSRNSTLDKESMRKYLLALRHRFLEQSPSSFATH